MTSETKKINELEDKLLKLEVVLGLPLKRDKLASGKELQASPDFWADREKVILVAQEAEALSAQIKPFDKLNEEIREAREIASLLEDEVSKEFLNDLNLKIIDLEKEIADLEFFSLLSDKYDNNAAFISLHSGTGGVDAQDWTEMLERMYLRFAERRGFKVEILDVNYGNEAGLKSADLKISGPFAYGYLKSENGTHRLLRNSPFNADGLRQTSFALIEVIPEIPESEGVIIKNEDVKIDVFRSSGPGGQSVNTTDSAVRLTHLPTGMVVSCQNERSQHQNKENAFKILRSKLALLALQAREVEEKKLKGGVQKADWGAQIRSYCLYGNKYVKDHRTNLETSNVEAVLGGDLEKFMEAYLRFLKN